MLYMFQTWHPRIKCCSYFYTLACPITFVIVKMERLCEKDHSCYSIIVHEIFLTHCIKAERLHFNYISSASFKIHCGGVQMLNYENCVTAQILTDSSA